MPHRPQLRLSVIVFTHVAEPTGQFVVPAAHTHEPDTQWWPEAQSVPQPPQLKSLDMVSTHVPGEEPQRVVPVGQPHRPNAQGPTAQTFPQTPQLLESVWMFTQGPPGAHRCWPDGQEHTPAVHVIPDGQALPHAPQLAGSDAEFTHMREQHKLPVVQA